jgi:hypothetical protein
MTPDPDDEQVVIYTGQYEEVLFLVSLLNGSDIPALMIPGSSLKVWLPPRLSVPRRCLDAALPLIEHFKQHGQKTPPQWM